jgi:hypothetical protein
MARSEETMGEVAVSGDQPAGAKADFRTPPTPLPSQDIPGLLQAPDYIRTLSHAKTAPTLRAEFNRE